MKKIGMIVAVEIKSVLDKFGAKLTEQKSKAGYFVLEYSTELYQLIIVSCGAGEIAAASGTQFLISEYHVDMVINFGIVGGLTEEMSKTKVCIVEKVVHYDFDTSTVDNVEVGRYLNYPDIYIPTSPQLLKKAIELNPKLLPVICASGDKFIADPEQKAELHRKFSAQICEMEAAGIVLTCNRNEVPCMMIKIISDGITGGVEEFLETKDEAATICLDIVTQLVNEMQCIDFNYYGTELRYLVLKRQGYKVLILEKDLVFYKIDEKNKCVVVYAVVDQRQDYLNIIRGL